jgi:site-specific DNA recombinase
VKENQNKNIVIIARVSTKKQERQGDSIKRQIEDCKRKLDSLGFDLKNIKKIFEIGESGSSEKEERDRFNSAIQYCIDKSNNIDTLIFKDIKRFTRSGSKEYDEIENLLTNAGVELIDTKGIIQPAVNLTEHTGAIWSWSNFKPSKKMERLEADESAEDRVEIIAKTTLASFEYAKKGYQHGGHLIGFNNEHLYTEDGKRVTRVPDPIEAPWIIRMFDMRASGAYSDDQIVKEINEMGFRTPIQKYRKGGTKGGKPLSIKKLQDYIIKTEYAGIKCETWGDVVPYKLVEKAHYKGLVDITTFNKANKGIVTIVEKGNDTYDVIYGKERIIRDKYNPNFPYKNAILCPVCRKPLKASFSTGKSKRRFPSYFCDRNHPRVSISKKDLETLVVNYLSRVKFTEESGKAFEQSIVGGYKERQAESVSRIATIKANITQKKDKQQEIKLMLAKVREIEGLFNDYLTDYINLDSEIKQLEKNLSILQDNELEFAKLTYFTKQLVEHPDKLVLTAKNNKVLSLIFNMIFDELPTVAELQSGTPKLSYVFNLKEDLSPSKNNMVVRVRIELT